jgi:hypothetical protein
MYPEVHRENLGELTAVSIIVKQSMVPHYEFEDGGIIVN